MKNFTTVAVAYGDGIGPEIMDAVLYILKEAEAQIKIEIIDIGEKLYNRNYTSGISQEAWDTIYNTKILLKSPITTPQGGGYKSLNVTLRKALGLYANVRPSISYHPFVETKHPKMDLTIIRENEEDIYAGIEYRHTGDTYESIKLISARGSERIARYAFEYAKQNGRKKVSCFVKDNIMKFTDGIFHKKFKEVAAEYPEIQSNVYIVDIGMAKLAASPEEFDVIVTSNLYGDIASDVASLVSGSVGLSGSSNIGDNFAMFEAVHGSAPDIADKGIANPSGLLNAAIMMLVYIGQSKIANLIENAWKKTIEDGIHTADIFNKNNSNQKVSTSEFAKAVVERFGQKPSSLKEANYKESALIKSFDIGLQKSDTKKLVGVDIFCNISQITPELIKKIQSISTNDSNNALELKTIASKGLKIWSFDNPGNINRNVLSDHMCLRFQSKSQNGTISPISHGEVGKFIVEFASLNIGFIKIENLYEFDGVRGFSLSQGE